MLRRLTSEPNQQSPRRTVSTVVCTLPLCTRRRFFVSQNEAAGAAAMRDTGLQKDRTRQGVANRSASRNDGQPRSMLIR